MPEILTFIAISVHAAVAVFGCVEDAKGAQEQAEADAQQEAQDAQLALLQRTHLDRAALSSSSSSSSSRWVLVGGLLSTSTSSASPSSSAVVVGHQSVSVTQSRRNFRPLDTLFSENMMWLLWPRRLLVKTICNYCESVYNIGLWAEDGRSLCGANEEGKRMIIHMFFSVRVGLAVEGEGC